jgi:FMN-binding domain
MTRCPLHARRVYWADDLDHWPQRDTCPPAAALHVKRLVLALLSTVAGLVGLFSFTTHPRPASPSGLPAACLAPARPSGPASSGPPPSPESADGASNCTPPAGIEAALTTVGKAVTTDYGTVQVKIVTSGTRIQGVSFVQLTADDPLSGEINDYAAPILLKQTLSAQNAHIDSVSGATYTSDGYRESLQSALDQAGLR